MTTFTHTGAARPGSQPGSQSGRFGGVAKAARIQLVQWKMVFGLPWAIMATSFAVNLLIYSVASTDPSQRTTGGLSSLYVTMMFTNLVTVTQIFPFSVSLSVTRRAFVAATVLIMAVQSLLDGVLLTALRFAESGTGGWSLKMHFFDLAYVRQSDPLTQMLVFATPLFVLSLLSVALGSIFHRWGVAGMWSTAVALIVAAGLVTVALTRFHWAHAVGSFFTGQPPLALLAGYPLVLAALLGLATTRMLTRARV